MYTWGDIKNATLAKLDLDDDEANIQNFTNRFGYFANEAMTQICSAIKPKHAYFEVEINSSSVGELINMPDDFISFDTDKNYIAYTDFNGNIVNREATGEDFIYMGYNRVLCKVPGRYYLSYNARWIENFVNVDDSMELDVPRDILDCLPSYIASQCYKVDDEYKAATFRNEYEIFLARIDDTHFKETQCLWIGGDW